MTKYAICMISSYVRMINTTYNTKNKNHCSIVQIITV